MSSIFSVKEIPIPESCADRIDYVFPFVRRWFYDMYSEVKLIGLQLKFSDVNTRTELICNNDFWVIPGSTDTAFDLKIKLANSYYSVSKEIEDKLGKGESSSSDVKIFNDIITGECVAAVKVSVNIGEDSIGLRYSDLEPFMKFYGVNHNDYIINFVGMDNKLMELTLFFKNIDRVYSEKDSKIICETIYNNLVINKSELGSLSIEPIKIIPIASDVLSGVTFCVVQNDNSEDVIHLRYRNPEGSSNDITNKIDEIANILSKQLRDVGNLFNS